MSNQFTVTPSQLIKFIDHYTSERTSKGKLKRSVAPFIWGGPGIGKTDLVRTVAVSRLSRIVALHLPQYDPTDIKGIPVKMDDGTVRWMPSSYLPQQDTVIVPNGETEISTTVEWQYATNLAVYVYDRDNNQLERYCDPTLPDNGSATYDVLNHGTTWTINVSNLPIDAYKIVIVDKAIVFLDELSTADTGTQNTALQLVLDRRVAEYDIPTGVPIIAAGNREDDGAFVQPLSHPLANRFAHLTLTPSVDDFIEWGMHKGIRPEILGFVKAYPDALYNYDPDSLTNGNYGFSTPRSLALLSDQYEDFEFFEDMHAGSPDAKSEAEHSRMVMFGGLIGYKDASRLISYLQVMHDLPSVEEVINGTADGLDGVERSKTFGLLYSLIQNLYERYKTYYNADKDADDQDRRWTDARDAIIEYITDNFEREAGSWAGAVIMQQMKFSTKALRSEAIMKFSSKYVDVMTRSA